MKLINKHHQIEQEVLPDFLTDGEEWHSMDINHEQPRVERLWRQVDQVHRILLLIIHPIADRKPVYHTHPWPCSVHVYGSYIMYSGSGPFDGPEPPVTMIQVIKSGSYYEMTHPDGWHAMSPLGKEPVLSTMLIGAPRRTVPSLHLGLGPVRPERKKHFIELFRTMFPLNGPPETRFPT